MRQRAGFDLVKVRNETWFTSYKIFPLAKAADGNVIFPFRVLCHAGLFLFKPGPETHAIHKNGYHPTTVCRCTYRSFQGSFDQKKTKRLTPKEPEEMREG